jgi:hypothetical protein
MVEATLQNSAIFSAIATSTRSPWAGKPGVLLRGSRAESQVGRDGYILELKPEWHDALPSDADGVGSRFKVQKFIVFFLILVIRSPSRHFWRRRWNRRPIFIPPALCIFIIPAELWIDGIAMR